MQRKYFFIALIILLILAGASYYFFFGSSGSSWSGWPAPYQNGMGWLEKYQQAMKADTYGGKTPEETLKLFVAALRQGDVALASKYFLLDKNLSRDKWITRLTQIKDKGLLNQMADDIEKKAKPGIAAYENDAKFQLFEDDGSIGVLIDMEKNTFTSLWKIESI